MTRSDSMRRMKNLLELENAKLRMMNGDTKSPRKVRGDYVGLKAMVVPKIGCVIHNVHFSKNFDHNTCSTTTVPRRKVSKATKLKDLEQGWINGFTKVDSPPPPPASDEPDMPPMKTFKSFPTTSSSSPSSSQDGGAMSRWSVTISSPSPSRSLSHEGGGRRGRQMRRWTDHRSSLVEEDCGNIWTRGKSRAQIELLSRKDMNTKILEAGWVSTFKPTQPRLRSNNPEM